MSDGLPERANSDGLLFDYHRLQEQFKSVANALPEEICSHLLKVGETWAGGLPQEDDVTLVVIRLK